MRNKIIGILIFILLISSTATLAIEHVGNNEKQLNHQFSKAAIPGLSSSKTNEISTKKTFTHTVFCELQTATWCPDCPTAVKVFYNIYNSNDYQFYYVSLIHDMNPIAKDRIREYKGNLFKNLTYIGFPTVYFDGGDKNIIGINKSVNVTEATYREIIEEVGNRSVTVPIELSSEIVWMGDGKITVTVTIKNNGDKPYLGKVRSYITEIVSRWKDSKRIPFDFGFLDFAIDESIFISAGETKNISKQWDATQAHGQNFGDISEDNIMVISTISHWIPHFRIGYKHLYSTQWYFAHYVDQTTAATPVS